MPYVRFSKDTRFDDGEYISRKWYQVPKALAEAMKEAYPASCAVASKPYEEETPGADDAQANLPVELELDSEVEPEIEPEEEILEPEVEPEEEIEPEIEPEVEEILEPEVEEVIESDPEE